MQRSRYGLTPCTLARIESQGLELTRLRGHSSAWAVRLGQEGCPDAENPTAVSAAVPPPGDRAAAVRHAAQGGRRRAGGCPDRRGTSTAISWVDGQTVTG